MSHTKRTWPERLLRLALQVALTLYGGWLFMLAVGVIHHEWIPACPTIGFWWATMLAMLVRGALYNFDLDKDSDR